MVVGGLIFQVPYILATAQDKYLQHNKSGRTGPSFRTATKLATEIQPNEFVSVRIEAALDQSTENHTYKFWSTYLFNFADPLSGFSHFSKI